MTNTVTLGGPIRDREDLAAQWVNSLAHTAWYLCNKDIDKYAIRYVFLEDSSTDSTYTKLLEAVHDARLSNALLHRYYKADTPAKRPNYSYERLAALRNNMLYMAFKDYASDYMLMVDSDITVEPECLYKLIQKDKDIIAACVRNSTADDVYNYTMYDPDTKLYRRNRKPLYIDHDMIQVDLTGACILLKRSVYDLGIRYHAKDNTPITEDVGFANECKKHDIPMYVHTSIHTVHYMTKDSALHSI